MLISISMRIDSGSATARLLASALLTLHTEFTTHQKQKFLTLQLITTVTQPKLQRTVRNTKNPTQLSSTKMQLIWIKKWCCPIPVELFRFASVHACELIWCCCMSCDDVPTAYCTSQ